MLKVKMINTPFGPVTKIVQASAEQITLDIPEIPKVEEIKKTKKKKEK